MLMGKLPHLEDDDFWNDCLKESPLQEIPASGSTSNTHHPSPVPPDQFSNVKSPLLQHLLAKEEEIPQKKLQKEEKAVEHCVELYNRCLAKSELQKQNASKIRTMTNNDEYSKCTFKPKTTSNKSIDKKLKDYHNTKIYARGIKYQQKHLANITKLYQDKSDDSIYAYSFKPQIKNTNLNEVFTDNSNKISTENDSNKLFIYRYMKAREEEEYKKNKILSDLSKNAKKNWNSKKKFTRSISQKDSICMKKTLHNVLLTAQFEEGNETE